MPVATANGKKFTFPEGTSPEQMGEAIDSYFAQNPPSPNQPPQMPSDEPGFLGRSADTVMDTIAKMGEHEGDREYRGQNVPDDIRRTFGPADYQSGLPARLMEGTSEAVSGMGSIAGDALMSAGRAILPQGAQDAIASGFQKVAGSAPVQAAGEMLSDFQEAAPNASKALGETLNVATAGAAPKASVKVTPVSRGLSKRITKLDDKVKKSRLEATTELLTPDGKTPDMADWDLTATGKKIYEPSPFEKKYINAVKELPEWNPKRSALYNNAVLRKAVEKEREWLDEVVQRKGVKEVDLDDLRTKFEDELAKVDEKVMLSGNIGESAKDIVRLFESKLEGNTPYDLLQARRAFDKEMLSQKGHIVFNPDKESSLSVGMDIIRRVVNNAVDEATPKVNVLESLEKQFHYLSAKNIVKAKAASEASSSLGRVLGRIEDKMGMKFPTTPLAAGATVGAGVAILGANPTLTTVIGSIAAAYGTTKGMMWLASPPGRQAVLKGIKLMADNPVLKTERLQLIEVYNQLNQLAAGEDEE